MKTDAARAQQDATILRLRCAGLSLRAIAERVGLSHQTVANRIEDAIRELLEPAAEEWRALETARLNDLTSAAYRVLGGAETDELRLKAIDRLLRLSESRRKLWGLDAQVPIDVVLSRRTDVEAHAVVAAVEAAVSVLGVDEGRRVLAMRAAVASLSGEPLPEAAAGDGEELSGGQAEMQRQLRDLVADEGIDIEALLREVDGDE